MLAVPALLVCLQWRAVLSAKNLMPPTSVPGDKTPSRGRDIGALGRLEPSGQIARVSLPAFLKDERVQSVLVKEGDLVKAGQVICRMDAQLRLLKELAIAAQEVHLARAKLNRVKAGAKEGEIGAALSAVEALRAEQSARLSAQEAIIAKAKAELEFQAVEAARFVTLQQEGAISLSQLDSKLTARLSAKANLAEALAERQRLTESIRARINEAKANVRRIKEVRLVDVDIAKVELDQAEARRDKLITDLELSQVTAPRDGRILKLNVRPGETVNERGIVELGSTGRMIAVAEVYQGDVANLRVGQKAIIRGDGIGGSVTGKVCSIGWEVLRQSVFAQDPSTASDARVVEVKVLIDDSFKTAVEKLSNMQVEVLFLQDTASQARGRKS